MNEKSLRQILAKLRINVERVSGEWLAAKCPLAQWTHESGEDSTPSFAAKINERGLSAYTCHACHHHGRISSLVRVLQKFRNKNYGSLAMDADRADLMGYVPPKWVEGKPINKKKPIRPIDEQAYEGVYDNPFDYKSAARYLADRGVSRKTARRIGLLYDPGRRRILFPVRNQNGLLFGYTGRKIYEGGSAPKILDYEGLPKRHLILGEHEWGDTEQDNRPILLVEGLFGYAHLIEIRADEIFRIGAILGSYMTPEKIQRVVEWDLPVYMAMDPDAAGDACIYGHHDKKGTWVPGGAEMLHPFVPVFIPKWPKGIIDPDQLTIKHIERMRKKSELYLPERK